MRDGCDGSFVDRVEDEGRLIGPCVGKRTGLIDRAYDDGC
jgi:hypothetical protein